MQYLINRYLCSESFSVDDPPNVMDPFLIDVAKFLSVHLENHSLFYKFGADLVSNKKVDVKIIQQDTTTKLPNKCLALIELWITSVADPKWQDLIEAAGASDLDRFTTALTAEFSSQKGPQKESVKWAKIGGNYKHIYGMARACMLPGDQVIGGIKSYQTRCALACGWCAPCYF